MSEHVLCDYVHKILSIFVFCICDLMSVSYNEGLFMRENNVRFFLIKDDYCIFIIFD